MVTRNLNLSEGWSERKGHLGQIELNNRKHTGGVASGIWYVIKNTIRKGVFSIRSTHSRARLSFHSDAMTTMSSLSLSLDWHNESYPAYHDFYLLPIFALFFPSLRFFLDRFIFEVRTLPFSFSLLLFSSITVDSRLITYYLLNL